MFAYFSEIFFSLRIRKQKSCPVRDGASLLHLWLKGTYTPPPFLRCDEMDMLKLRFAVLPQVPKCTTGPISPHNAFLGVMGCRGPWLLLLRGVDRKRPRAGTSAIGGVLCWVAFVYCSCGERYRG